MANKQIAAHFARQLAQIGWSGATLAARIGCDQKTASNWATAAREIPGEVLAWLDSLAAWLRQNPPPDYRDLRPPGGKPSRRIARSGGH